jgi:hypothetical protein
MTWPVVPGKFSAPQWSSYPQEQRAPPRVACLTHRVGSQGDGLADVSLPFKCLWASTAQHAAEALQVGGCDSVTTRKEDTVPVTKL